jgi:caspase domain-containing protein
MMRIVSASVFTCIAALVPAPAWSAVPLQRYALVVGANSGGGTRPALLYAVADAERFARVMTELGGVEPANAIVLKQPKLRELIDALDALSKRVNDARRSSAGSRTEIVVYYSGHADEQGLLLGDDRYSYRTLRDRLDQIPADVRIAVLDACSSGAFTRMKGGRARPAFLVDESTDMRGHAFLTSSAESEAAQESDRIRASYFTHYLVSGFRGAADLSGDGKVTLNEAYQFAFNETLGRTVNTKGGAQHPSYDINLSGTGDVVMTDVRQTTAALVLGEDLEGRFFVRTSSHELVVELYKPRGRRVELAVEPGVYEVRLERENASLTARADVDDGQTVTMDPRQFGATATESTRSRGDAAPAGNAAPAGDFGARRYAVAGRHRIEGFFGMWRASDGVSTTPVVTTGDTFDAFGGAAYTKYVHEDLAVRVAVEGFGVESGVKVGRNQVSSGFVGGAMFPLEVHWNPWPAEHAAQALKPFLTVGGGPVVGISEGTFVGDGVVQAGDVHVTRSFSIGMNAAYNWMLDFAEPIGGHKNFSGVQVGIAFGWLFGKGNP